MIKLLVIADDFTGALDTGVQFKARGTQIRVAGLEEKRVLETLKTDLQVLIIDAETRHMGQEEARDVVFRIVAEAVEAGVPCIYKKTDSGLRGNIGSELTGMLEASGERRLHFIPAFPKMGRKTMKGIHYIEGVPVAESVFGADPFEPVCHSAVRDIIASQSKVETHLVGSRNAGEGMEGILIYDAATDEELSRIALTLKQRSQLRLLAGCAGFAAVLPRLLELEQDRGGLPEFHPRLVTVCGSINPITVGQLDEAEREGMLRISLTPQQKLDPGWLNRPEGGRCLDQWLTQMEGWEGVILECGVEDHEETRRYMEQTGLSVEEMRGRISAAMGGVLKGLLDRGLAATLLVTGGDTLLAFLRQIDQEELVPVGELMPGIVLSQITYRNKTYNLISKSGGFGPPTVLADLKHLIHHHCKEELVC